MRLVCIVVFKDSFIVNACMYVNVIVFIIRHKVNIVDTEARMVFLGGHPAKY